MQPTRTWSFTGTNGRIHAQAWDVEGRSTRYVAVLCHGYGEHIGRYGHVAGALVNAGAEVYGLDHIGHGRSTGERVLITDFDDVVADLHNLIRHAARENPGTPLVLIGHSMGGMIAARYAQVHGSDLSALVLSGPVLGRWRAAEELAAADQIPDEPLDPATLSRDEQVGLDYAADPLVWHGPFKRPTVQAILDTLEQIDAGGPLGTLPTLWVHGAEDALVPVADSRLGIEAVRGSNLTEQVLPGARHEVFNETNREEVLALVTTFIDEALHGAG